MTVQAGTLLAINAGSSSVKFQLFDLSPDLERLACGKVDHLGGTPAFTATDELTGATDAKSLTAACTHEVAFRLIFDWIEAKSSTRPLSAIVHRIVHGGSMFTGPVVITPEIIEQLKSLNPLAPLHEPHNLAAIEIIGRIHPNTTQIACFDTAFHAGHDALFTAYALPQKIRDRGVRRYGFHGLSYEWIAHVLKRDEPTLARGRIIAAHLGNGSSLCAMRDGVSIDTTMGMTALEGLPMGTRCGALDPGAVIHMIRELGFSPDEAEHCLYNESGLLGLSGLTNDVKALQDNTSEAAHFALDYFALRVAQYIGMMAVTLGGMDGIVFTGGIGENSSIIRDKILAHIAFLRPFEIRVILANEERIMAMHAQSLLTSRKGCIS